MEEQYYLSKYANISLDICSELPDFERKAYISLVIKDLQKKAAMYDF